MKIVKGKYNKAKIFTDNVDDVTYEQVQTLLDQEFVKGSKIRIMPDCHAGAGCVIGTTMTITDKIVPNLVGVDIGCGMLTYNLGNIEIDLEALDNFIRRNIPAGRNVHRRPQELDVDITKLKCWRTLGNYQYYYRSVGTLGGGNHFIEIDVDDEGNKYLIIHTGSRNLGNKVAQYYQQKAIKYIQNKVFEDSTEVKEFKQQYQDTLTPQQMEKNLKRLRRKNKEIPIPRDLCYLEGQDMQDYLHDMDICQRYANSNRYSIGKRILDFLNIKDSDIIESFVTVHNYINMDDMILRKGAISAYKDEKVLIPINMRDGCIIAIGKGNPDYNYSAPHGAGRVLSRREAQRVLNLDNFKQSMKGIYSTSVSHRTLDEAPMAYKPIGEILDNITETVIVDRIIKPIYNFKG